MRSGRTRLEENLVLDDSKRWVTVPVALEPPTVDFLVRGRSEAENVRLTWGVRPEDSPDGVEWIRAECSCDCPESNCIHALSALNFLYDGAKEIFRNGTLIRLLDTTDRPSGPPTPPWKSRVQSLKSLRESRLVGRKTRGEYQLSYLLNTDRANALDEFTIQLECRRLKRNGSPGAVRKWGRRLRDELADERDKMIVDQLNFDETEDYLYGRYYGRSAMESQATLRLPAQLSVLKQMCDTGRLMLVDDDAVRSEAVRFDAHEHLAFVLKIHEEANGDWVAEGALENAAGEGLRLQEAVLVGEHLAIFPDRIAPLDGQAVWEWILEMLDNPSLVVDMDSRRDFVEWLWNNESDLQVRYPENFELQRTTGRPQPCLTFEKPAPRSKFLEGRVLFDYGEKRRVAYAATNRGFLDWDAKEVIERDCAEERRLAEQLQDAPFRSFRQAPDTGEPLVEASAIRFPELTRLLISRGWQVLADGAALRSPGAVSVSVRSGVDWFELDATLDFEGQTAQVPRLLEALRRGDDFVVLDDGSHGMLPEDWLTRFGALGDLAEVHEGKLRFRPSQALLLDSLLADQPQADLDAQFQEVQQKLRSFAGVKPKKEPRGFSGELRTYQREGLGWFDFLREFRFGGCLADDMGLGKTIQVLALLESLRAQKNRERLPSLVVAPRSLVFNWIAEAQRFTPKLKVLDFSSPDRSQHVESFADYHLAITTYGVLRRDIEWLKDQPLEIAILDEAQAIKNHASLSSKAARLLNAKHRLALSGTPIENHLGELWALFEFLNPGMLGRLPRFEKWVNRTQAPDAEQERELLSKALRPFILRRTKSQVLTELPEKSEQTIHCEMSPAQKKLYNELRDYYRASLSNKVAADGLNRSKMHVLEALLRLRQAACHPALLDKKRSKARSAKLDALMEHLEEVLDSGHKALVFSQFTKFLALVRKELDAKKVCYEYLDGRTSNRQAKVRRFQEDDDCRLFLISLKAGGHGLNLTAADYVYLLDPWWNPAVESQAIDRAHRLGQNKRVFAYRLICKDTVEEKIIELQKSKRALADAVITQDNSILKSLSPDDLQLLLG